MASKISQEFYCGECQSYFQIRLNTVICYEVLVVCPGCGHEHQRCVDNGHVKEQGRFQSGVVDKIMPTKATLRKTPLTQQMVAAHEANNYMQRRDGVILAECWMNVAARERGEEIE